VGLLFLVSLLFSSYDLLFIIDFIFIYSATYPWNFSRVNSTTQNESGVQNMKTEPDALATVENESGAQNMKAGPDALATVEYESGSAKHENETRRPRYRRK
jgi:hypothetical protein